MPYATILGIAPRGSLGSGPPTDHPFHPTISIGPGDRKNRSDPWAVPRKKNFQPFHALILPCTGSTPPLQSIFRGALNGKWGRPKFHWSFKQGIFGESSSERGLFQYPFTRVRQAQGKKTLKNPLN